MTKKKQLESEEKDMYVWQAVWQFIMDDKNFPQSDSTGTTTPPTTNKSSWSRHPQRSKEVKVPVEARTDSIYYYDRDYQSDRDDSDSDDDSDSAFRDMRPMDTARYRQRYGESRDESCPEDIYIPERKTMKIFPVIDDDPPESTSCNSNRPRQRQGRLGWLKQKSKSLKCIVAPPRQIEIFANMEQDQAALPASETDRDMGRGRVSRHRNDHGNDTESVVSRTSLIFQQLLPFSKEKEETVSAARRYEEDNLSDDEMSMLESMFGGQEARSDVETLGGGRSTDARKRQLWRQSLTRRREGLPDEIQVDARDNISVITSQSTRSRGSRFSWRRNKNSRPRVQHISSEDISVINYLLDTQGGYLLHVPSPPDHESSSQSRRQRMSFRNS